MASSATVSTTTPLDAAITTASSSTLRQLIRLIGREATSGEEYRVRTLGSARRNVPRFAFCETCKAEFDVTKNTKESCRYHPCSAEPTGEELWEDNRGEFDVEAFRDELPHCYTFSCCDGNLETNPYGCVLDWHKDVVEQNPYKRPRII
ncbi:uncharacterized protein N7498_005389 [Penicillium cinerascens]|uniref:C2H2-type domain-containing protein n=1 Tax=Penicillium cinerascens TaxID=70096 RepID=A0A9W9MNB5_9EURO|nr:uncharacterized protein N7498_005389 [Penicillium cinerascens]KAJ5204510.1 hypothetical protein N7498_005389 [Penicillium cinerascens]